jgi:hypothetical protein
MNAIICAFLMMLAAGTHLGPYEILEPLGAGGMGEVYRARDVRLDRSVALKTMATDLALNAESRSVIRTSAHSSMSAATFRSTVTRRLPDPRSTSWSSNSSPANRSPID